MRKLWAALGSVRLAVVLMIVLAAVCAAATFYESAHGTAATQRTFYGTAWFSGLLVLLGLNVLVSMTERYPWSRHQAGFVLAHLGILAILGGSLLSLHLGLDSTLALYEGQGSDRVELADKALQVVLADGEYATMPVDLESRPPRPEAERRFAVGRGIALVADAYERHVHVHEGPNGREVVPEPAPNRGSHRLPAVRLRLEGPSLHTQPAWVAWGEARQVATTTGPVLLAWRSPEVQLPFRVTLLDFRADTYPGSRMAATYESRVRIDDAERGSAEHRVAMNRPLHYRGYVFFQASYVEGEPMASVFSVSRAPGLPVVYLGVALTSAGIAWMFYLKPYLARRQGKRALRELATEALAASPARA